MVSQVTKTCPVCKGQGIVRSKGIVFICPTCKRYKDIEDVNYMDIGGFRIYDVSQSQEKARHD